MVGQYLLKPTTSNEVIVAKINVDIVLGTIQKLKKTKIIKKNLVF